MPTKTKKKRSRKLIIWIIVAVIVVAAIVGFIVFRPKSVRGTTYESHTAFSGDIIVTVNGSGAIESHDDETIYVKYPSEVKEVIAENGDILKKGDIIAYLESDSLDEEIKMMRSEISSLEASIKRMDVDASDNIRNVAEGRVKEIFAEEDMDIDTTMSTYGALAIISTDDMLKADIKVSDTASYTVGNEVMIMIDEDKETATIETLDKVASVLTVIFEDDEDEDYEIGESITMQDSNGKTVGKGILELNHPLYITAKGGICEQINADVNEWIDEGINIIVRDGDVYEEDYINAIDELEQKRQDLNEMENAREELAVRAPMDGVVSGLEVNEGQHLTQGMIVAEIKGNSMLKILVEIDELDIAKIEIGQTADINLDALEDKEYTAKVTDINPIGISINNVTNYIITLELPSNGEILLGMSAEVDIFAQESKDAVLIPIEAIQTINDEHYIMMADEIGILEIATHKVEVGLTDGVNIEIVDGLDAGEAVAVPVEYIDPMAAMMEMQQQGPAQQGPQSFGGN